VLAGKIAFRQFASEVGDEPEFCCRKWPPRLQIKRFGASFWQDAKNLTAFMMRANGLLLCCLGQIIVPPETISPPRIAMSTFQETFLALRVIKCNLKKTLSFPSLLRWKISFYAMLCTTFYKRPGALNVTLGEKSWFM
jgi:hypothetical protein